MLSVWILCALGGAAACGGPPGPHLEPAHPPANQRLGAEPQAPAPPVAAGSAPCQTDDGCVPNACCHATGCVAAALGPDCRRASCTRECRPNTVHCGGRCSCQQGVCVPDSGRR